MRFYLVTRLLEHALEMVSRLPESEQDAIAAQRLADLRADEKWDAKFAAARAVAEHRAGLNQPGAGRPVEQ